MSENTTIEWCDATFNPFEGCQKISPGCDHCYAEARNARFSGGTAVNWGPGAPRRRTSAANWRKPIAWNAAHETFFATHGRRRRVFCASLADVFDNAVPDAWRMDLFKLIADTPNLDWLILTKRIGNVRPYSQRDGLAFDLIGDGRIWLGATVVNQEEADRDIPKLLAVPARVRFLSMEPLLGPVTFRWAKWIDHDAMFERKGTVDFLEGLRGIAWIIAGGESGRGARAMHPDWIRDIRDQCLVAGVPFLFKQWGEWAPLMAYTDRGDGLVAKVGKKAAGRWLDGRTHDEFPSIEA